MFYPAQIWYDPTTDTWYPIASIGTPRYDNTITLLPNDQVLVTGGLSSSSQVTDSAEIYHYAPIATSFSKSIYEDSTLMFTANDFINNFMGSGLTGIKILSLPTNGILKSSDRVVIVNQVIEVNDLNNLTYIPMPGYTGIDSFSWNGSDGYAYATTPAEVNMNIKTKDSSNVPNSDSAEKLPNCDIECKWVIVGSAAAVIGVVATVAMPIICWYYKTKTHRDVPSFQNL